MKIKVELIIETSNDIEIDDVVNNVAVNESIITNVIEVNAEVLDD